MRYEKYPTMGQMRKAESKLLKAVKAEGFNSIEHFKDFYDVACGFSDVDVPLTQCFELALESSIEDEDDRYDKAITLSDIVTNFYWYF